MRRSVAAVAFIGLATGIAGTTGTVQATTALPAAWQTQPDFESNASTAPGAITNRQNIDITTTVIDPTTSRTDVKIGFKENFVTNATITCTTPKRVYTTGVDRTSIAAVDSVTKSLTTIALPGRPAGVVYNSENHKVYVGQYDNNEVTIIDDNQSVPVKTGTFTSGAAGKGAYALAYNAITNKVYIANTGDQTVSIFSGASEGAGPLNTVPVVGGASSASFDGTLVYFTSKSNNYLTIVDGTTNILVQTVQIDPVLGTVGSQSPGYVGLRVDARALGLVGADRMRLIWNADRLGPNQNIQFQVRTAADLASLDGATYLGPDQKSDQWYDAAGAETVTESDGTETHIAELGIPYPPAAEIQVKLSWDGTASPVLHKVRLDYAFTIDASAGPGGTIDPPGRVSVSYGESQVFGINPSLGYHSVDVKVDGISQGPISSYTFSNVTASHTISATFAPNTYTITASAGPGGTISPSGAVTVTYGDCQKFDITADPCYHIADVLVDGVSVGPVPTYTFCSINANHTIAVTFAINTYTVTFSAGPNGSISGPTPQTITCGGTTAPVTATPSNGYRFVNWTGTNGFVSTDNPLIVTNVTSNLDITANFTPISFSHWQTGNKLLDAWAVAFDGSGSIYASVPATVNGVAGKGIGKFTPPATDPVWVGTYNNAPILHIKGVSADADGNVYTADMSNSTFAMFKPGQSTTPFWSQKIGANADCITSDRFGNIYGAEQTYIYTFTFNGTTYTQTRKVIPPLSGIARGIALDSNNNLLFLTSGGNYGYIASGSTSMFASGTNIGSGTTFNSIAIDKNDNSYVIIQNGTTMRLARIPKDSTTPNWSVDLATPVPAGPAVDKNGNVYVVDGTQIKMYTPALGTTVQWSTSSTGNNFVAVAVDASGDHVAAVETLANILHVYTRN